MWKVHEHIYSMALVFYEWLFHKHIYKGPFEMGFHPILRDTFENYGCHCGAKIRVLNQGEILLMWNNRKDIIFNSLRSSLGGTHRTRRFVNNYHPNTTNVIKESEIDLL